MNDIKKKHLKLNKKSSYNLTGNFILKKKHKLNTIYFKLNIISLVFALTLIISIINLADWYFNNETNNEMISTVSEYIEYSETIDNTFEPSVDFENLKLINDSCFAWLVVNGTNINYPVVKYSNNEYYINHSFDNSNNSAGWIFADYRDNCDGTDKNLSIYGHNRKDETMFSTLRNILKDEWYNNEDNLIVKLYTPDGLIEYKVFSVYEVRAESYFATTLFASDSSYLGFLNNIKNRSIHDFNVELSEKDSIITLSTCSNNSAFRTVLHAKKIN